MSKLMLDTNVFNEVVRGDISIDLFKNHEIFATHIQLDEITRTKEDTVREKLESAFMAIVTTKIATSSMVWDVSRWDESSWSDGEKFNEMKQRLVELDKNKSINKKTPNQVEPHRDCRRLLILRKRSHDEQYKEQVFT